MTTVAELITALQLLPEDAPVAVDDALGGLRVANIVTVLRAHSEGFSDALKLADPDEDGSFEVVLVGWREYETDEERGQRIASFTRWFSGGSYDD